MVKQTAAQRIAERLNDWLDQNRTLPDDENAWTVAEDLGVAVDPDATERALDLFGDCDPIVVDGELVRYDYGDGRYCVFDWAAIVEDMEASHLTPDDKRMLGALATRDEAGRHFTEVYGEDWLQRMEEAGYIQITRPVHQATGIAYSQEYWTVEVSPEVGEWFDEYGELLDA